MQVAAASIAASGAVKHPRAKVVRHAFEVAIFGRMGGSAVAHHDLNLQIGFARCDRLVELGFQVSLAIADL